MVLSVRQKQQINVASKRKWIDQRQSPLKRVLINIHWATVLILHMNILPKANKKKDKEIHGFGIMNIRDIIDKYNGTINYEQHGDNYLMCRCRLKKICQ